MPLTPSTGSSSDIRCAICRLLTWWRDRPSDPDVLADVYDGQKWKDAILQDPRVSSDTNLGRNLALGFCADGISPFKRTTYSMWPMAMSCYNLPAHVRMTLPALWVPAIVNGYGTGEPDDFSSVMEIVADELNHLYLFGVEVEDSTHRYIFLPVTPLAHEP